MFGIPIGAGALAAVVLSSIAPEPAPPSTLLLGVILGGVFFGLLGMGFIWLAKKLVKSQIDGY